MRRVIILVVAVIVIAVVATPLAISVAARSAGAGGQGGAGNAQANVKRVTIDKGNLQLTVTATGNLVPPQQSNLSFDQPGRVQQVLVQQNQKVEAGQVLARQDDSSQRADLAQADNNLRAANAALQKLLEPVDPDTISQGEANVKAAQAAYSSQAGSVSPQQIKTAQLQVQKAQQAAEDANKVRADAGGRYTQDDPNYQKAVAQAGQAQVNAQVAQLKLQQATRGTSLTQATANISYQQALLAQTKAGPLQTDIDTAQANYEIAKLQRDQAQHALDNTELVAPFAGIVSTVNINPGEVSTGVAMVLTDTNNLYADINVDETDIGKIRIGQPVQITLDALPGNTLTGKVLRIAQTADTTASVITYVVRVALDHTTAPLRVGMTANAVFVVREAQNVVRIPNDYLRLNRATNQASATLVSADGAFIQVPVKLGLQGTDYSEVVEGLRAGDTVALVTGQQAGGAAAATSQ